MFYWLPDCFSRPRDSYKYPNATLNLPICLQQQAKLFKVIKRNWLDCRALISAFLKNSNAESYFYQDKKPSPIMLQISQIYFYIDTKDSFLDPWSYYRMYFIYSKSISDSKYIFYSNFSIAFCILFLIDWAFFRECIY